MAIVVFFFFSPSFYLVCFFLFPFSFFLFFFFFFFPQNVFRHFVSALIMYGTVCNLLGIFEFGGKLKQHIYNNNINVSRIYSKYLLLSLA